MARTKQKSRWTRIRARLWPTRRDKVFWIVGASCAAVAAVGLISGLPLLTGLGFIGLAAELVLAWRWHREVKRGIGPPEIAVSPTVKPKVPANPSDTAALVDGMLAQGRFALLLRPQIVNNLTSEQFERAREALSESMALVPEGEVVLGNVDHLMEDGRDDDANSPSHAGKLVRVASLFLDRYPVTNEEYFQFVSAGGYEQMAIWDANIWAGVLDFVDQTGDPGPRFWQDGRFPEGLERHPVVGISWYEAAAYARWAGKRLPSDAEWVKAGSWPVPVGPEARVQRKYPWGNAMDRGRCNLWGSGPAQTAEVTEFSEGMSVGGIHQLIGNVWEWMASNFGAPGLPTAELALPTPMKSVRGGAFDTYFENQASCQFQSGEQPVARKHNIGFRCAVSLCDVVLSLQAPDEPEPEQEHEHVEVSEAEHEEVTA